MRSVMAFAMAFAISFAVLAVVLASVGNDFLTSTSGAAAALANVGPGLGDTIGPSGKYADLNDISKWVLAAGMLLGRLEIFSLIVLLAPGFWRY